MLQRIVAASVCVVLALVILLIRYVPPRMALHEFGDPGDEQVIGGVYAAERSVGGLVRRAREAAAIRLPLADGRGAARFSLTWQSGGAQPALVQLALGGQTLIVRAAPRPRSLHVLSPARAARLWALDLTPVPDAAADGVILDRVVVWGRGGWPALIDWAALLLLALTPGLLVALTSRLPLDWALLPSVIVLLVLLVLPAADRGPLLRVGPLLPIVVAGLTLLPIARVYAPIALVAGGGALLRAYALGWGSGYTFGLDDGQVAWERVLLIRGVAVLLGAALIIAVYGLGRALLKPRWALLAAGFVAVAPLLVQSSHLGSMAQGAALLVVLAVWALTALTMRRWQAVRTARFLPHVRAAWWRGITMFAVLAVVSGAWALIITATPSTASSLEALPPRNPLLLRGYAQSYLYTLFNMLAWGLGPLLTQLGVVGWAVQAIVMVGARHRGGAVAARAWLPLLLTSALVFVVAGADPARNLTGLIVLAPLLCVFGAALLQRFSQRLSARLGRRVVRLLATTAVLLALVVSLGLLNVYREPDARIAASRWLIRQSASNRLILHDASVRERLPLGAPHLWPIVTLPTPDQPRTLAQSQLVSALQNAQYIVIGIERDDLDLPGLAQRDPLAACYYRALFDGRLGFVPRARFMPMPHIGAWQFDDRATDLALRQPDHPRIIVWERYSQPTERALNLLLSCAP